MGAAAPSDTGQAPADLLGMVASVPGAGGAAVGLLESLIPVLTRIVPEAGSILRTLAQDIRGGIKIPGTSCPALRAQLGAEETLASSGHIAAAGPPLELGAPARTAVFDTATKTLHAGPPGPLSHAGLVEGLGLPLDEGRYVGGFLNVSSEGSVVFEATSGTFPSAGAGLPPNVLDMVRGTGVTVVE